ncbi:unnamed protein product [Phytomonas sp. Hart1]|nr:unnamed protein product [Phytomonas sp. Hart1]|eukprot:CCW71690.1 unnamed protein product [Phytomonas sp. isolate Hart1]
MWRVQCLRLLQEKERRRGERQPSEPRQAEAEKEEGGLPGKPSQPARDAAARNGGCDDTAPSSYLGGGAKQQHCSHHQGGEGSQVGAAEACADTLSNSHGNPPSSKMGAAIKVSTLPLPVEFSGCQLFMTLPCGEKTLPVQLVANPGLAVKADDDAESQTTSAAPVVRKGIFEHTKGEGLLKQTESVQDVVEHFGARETDKRLQARRKLEFHIARHDQLLNAIAKLQRTAADQTSRVPD